MKAIVLFLAVGVVGLWCCDRGFAQPATVQPLGAQGAALLGALPQEVRSKIEQLAGMLQQNIREGRLTDAQVEQELQAGNLASLIKGVSPDANQLFEEIRSSLQANQSPEALSLLLQGMTSAGR